MTKKRKRKVRHGIPRPVREIASTEATAYPNVTSGPDAPLDRPSTERWIRQDSTSVPDIGEESEAAEPLAQSQWELIDKYIIRRKIIPFALSIIAISFIIIQDNGAGKLTDWKDMLWTIQKSFVVLGLYAFFGLIQWLLQVIFKK